MKHPPETHPESWRWPFVMDTKQTQARRAPRESWWLDRDRFYDRAKEESLRMNAQNVVKPKEPD